MPVGPPTPVTALADLEVYAADGLYVGRIVDLVVDLEAGGRPALALQDVNESLRDALPEDAAGLRVPYRDVRAVGDVVVLSRPASPAVGAAIDGRTPAEDGARPESRSVVEPGSGDDRSDDDRDLVP